MIVWDKPKRVPMRDSRGQPGGGFHSYQESAEPRGYILNMVPYGDLCHMEAIHVDGDGRCTFIGRVADIPVVLRATRNEAAQKLRAACDDHAVSIQPAPAAP